MKALITAGGRATRLRPITWNRNKHSIPLANKPMLQYAIEKIVDAGVTDIGISVNEGEQELQKVFGNGEKFNCTITYIEQRGGALGLAHVVKNARDEGFLRAGDSFIMYLGDNILGTDINALINKFKQEEFHCMLALSRVPDPERFGVPEIKDGKIIRVEEKPKEPKSDFAITGIYVYDHHALEVLDSLQKSARGEYEITDIHQYYIDKGLRVGFEEIKGWWKDTGKPEDLLIGNQYILDGLAEHEMEVARNATIHPTAKLQGKVRVGANAVIGEKTLIRGPVVIGENCIIENSYIGPYTSLGNNVTIRNSEIEHSIVLDGAQINAYARVVDSIVGAGATISRVQDSLPHGHKLVIGDNSVVEL